MSDSRKKNHFVDAKKFYDAMCEYRKMCDEAAASDLPRPRIPNYVGECFLKIATHLAHRPNFSNYVFVEEMISDAIESMIIYCHNFDPTKTKSAFAYFTQISWYSFLRRIEREKKQLAVFDKMVEKSSYSTFFEGDVSGTLELAQYEQLKSTLDIKRRNGK